MNIVTILNAHGNTDLVLDTIDSIKTFVGDKILVVVDGAAWDDWGEKVSLPALKVRGLNHNFYKAPYRNYTLGLKLATEKWDPKEVDWYCYVEYDVLFNGSEFKRDLELAKQYNVWCLGNDLRISSMKFKYLEKIIKEEIASSYYLLGCCVFHNSHFMNVLKEHNFFDTFLTATNEFLNGYFPGYEEQGGYDFGEHLYPTLANHFGGKVAQFAYWNEFLEQWNGKAFKKYQMRWKPEITLAEAFPEASVLHPVKERELRSIYSRKRKFINV